MSFESTNNELAMREFLRADYASMSPHVAARISDQHRIVSALTHKRRVTWDELDELVKMDPARLCVAAIRLSQMGAVRVDVNPVATAIYLTPRLRKLIGVREPQASL